MVVVKKMEREARGKGGVGLWLIVVQLELQGVLEYRFSRQQMTSVLMLEGHLPILPDWHRRWLLQNELIVLHKIYLKGCESGVQTML